MRASPVAFVCALCAGLATGSVWAVGPLVGRSFGLEDGAIGGLMSVAIIGGAVSQLPIGRLSDRVDRRYVLAGLAAVGVAISIGGWYLAAGSSYALFGAMFLVGACSMPFYALCIATAIDHTDLQMIQIGSGILFVNSMGSIIGPLIVAPLMTQQGGGSFFLYLAVCFGLAMLWTVYRIVRVDRPQTHEYKFESVPKTTAVVLELSEETPLEDGVEASGL
jgi:MFS family permease